jgi:uncharacterized protein YjgD (DUF1641 family)
LVDETNTDAMQRLATKANVDVQDVLLLVDPTLEPMAIDIVKALQEKGFAPYERLGLFYVNADGTVGLRMRAEPQVK